MLTEERLKKVRDAAAETAITPIRLKSNVAIVHRVIRHVKKAESEEDLYLRLLRDYPAWCAAFLDNSKRRPLVLAPWQVEFHEARLKFPQIWTMACRKTGKTAALASDQAWQLCALENTRSVAFAPTADQGYVFGMMREHFGGGILHEVYIKDGGSNLGEEITLSNGSKMIKHGLALAASRGKYSLGEYGDNFVIDEYQLVPRDVYTSIIQPMRFDAYSRKTTVFIGTADLDANPTLDQLWEDWQKCEGCGETFKSLEERCVSCDMQRERATLSVDVERGILEGCVNPKEVDRFKAEATPDEVDMYLYCRFPRQSDRFYDRATLYGSPNGTPFLKPDESGLPIPEPGANYAMSVDWAKQHDRTEILVADVSKNELHYRFWRRIFPKGKEYSEQRAYVKRLFHRLRATWIVADATSTQDTHIEELTRGEDAIPPGSFYKTKMASGEERLGYYASTQTNFEMHRNHKLNVVNGKIRISHDDPMFLEWVKQHNQLEKRAVQGGSLIALEAPKNGFKDLAIVSAMLSLRLRSGMSRPFMGVEAF